MKVTKGLAFASKMFKNCSSLNMLSFPQFRSFILFDMNEMFSGCINLTSLNLGQLSTVSVRNMNRMFYNCSSLEYLNISNFNDRNLEHFEDIFEGIKKNNSFKIEYNEDKIKKIKNIIKDDWKL